MAQDSGARESVTTSSDSPKPTRDGARWHAMQVGGHVPLYEPHMIQRTYTDPTSNARKLIPPNGI